MTEENAAYAAAIHGILNHPQRPVALMDFPPYSGVRPTALEPEVLGGPFLPGGAAHQFIRHIRSLPAHQGGLTPAIALSGFTLPEDRIKSLEAGFQQHLTKPLDFRTLLDAITQILRSQDTYPQG